MICKPHQIIFRMEIMEQDDMVVVCGTCKWERITRISLWENVKSRDCLEDLGIREG